MAVLFRFVDDDEIIRAYLPATMRGAVRRWQTNFDYSFEFHGGHPTGHPIYVRPNDNRDVENVPKFDTLNKSDTDYTLINSFANGGKLRGALSNAAQDDILAVVENNWSALATLATKYWLNQPVDPARDAESIKLAAWAQSEMDSDTGQHFQQISKELFNKMYPF